MNDNAQMDSSRGLGHQPNRRGRRSNRFPQVGDIAVTGAGGYTSGIKESGAGYARTVLAAAIRRAGTSLLKLRATVQALMLSAAQLKDLMRRGREALTTKDFNEKSHRALVVLPELLAALDEMVARNDRLQAQQNRLIMIRYELTLAVRAMREEVWKGQKQAADVTYSNARVNRRMMEIHALLNRLEAEVDAA